MKEKFIIYNYDNDFIEEFDSENAVTNRVYEMLADGDWNSDNKIVKVIDEYKIKTSLVKIGA